MAWEAPQGDAVPLSEMVKPAYHRVRLSQAPYSSAVLSHRVSSDTTSCSSPAIGPEVSSFHAFPFCVGNQHLRKGKVYRWGNLSPFFLEEVPWRELLLQAQAVCRVPSWQNSVPAPLFPSVSLWVALAPYLAWTRSIERATRLGRKWQATSSASIKWQKSTWNKGTMLIHSSWGLASPSVCATRNSEMPVGIFSGRSQRLVTEEVESLTGWWKSWEKSQQQSLIKEGTEKKSFAGSGKKGPWQRQKQKLPGPVSVPGGTYTSCWSESYPGLLQQKAAKICKSLFL